MTADGVWTYTLDNANSAVQALNDCDTLTDCFTVTTQSAPQVVTITINGSTDDTFHFKDKMSDVKGLTSSTFRNIPASNQFCPKRCSSQRTASSETAQTIELSAQWSTLCFGARPGAQYAATVRRTI